MKHVAWSLVLVTLGAARAQQAPTPAVPPPTASAAETPAQPDWHRAPQHWNVEVDGDVKVALQGYDPVAYFPEGGGKPAEGSTKFAAVHGGITYRFTSDEHRKLFLADPWKYEPAYGGWCAYAMADGEKVEVDPESFRVLDGRLFVFYDGLFADTRKSWLKDETALLEKADAAWPKLSGEKNRGDAARRAAESAVEAGPATGEPPKGP
jgi:YHS domain-containing protein